MTYLGPTALAAALGVTRVMIYHYERAGKLPKRKNGGWDLKEARKSLAKHVGRKQGGPLRTGDRKTAENGKHRKRSTVESGVQEDLTLEDDPNDKSKAQLEKEFLLEKTEKVKLENAEKQRILVNRADVEASVESRFRADSEALLSWPSSISAEMAAELGISERILFPVLDRYIRQFMRDRSNVGVAA